MLRYHVIMNKRLQAIVLAAFLGFAGGLRAEIKYTFVDLAYQYHDYEGEDLDGGHGFKLGLSISPIPILFFTGSVAYSQAESSFLDSYDVDNFEATVGGGAYLPLGEVLHLVGEVGVIYSQVDTSLKDLEVDEAGFYLRPQVRVAVSEQFELNGGAKFTTVENATARFNVGIGVDLVEHIRLLGDFEFGEEENIITGGLRLQW
jgi:hypothetical protein